MNKRQAKIRALDEVATLIQFHDEHWIIAEGDETEEDVAKIMKEMDKIADSLHRRRDRLIGAT